MDMLKDQQYESNKKTQSYRHKVLKQELRNNCGLQSKTDSELFAFRLGWVWFEAESSDTTGIWSIPLP